MIKLVFVNKKGIIPWLIKFFTQSSYNHVGIVDGEYVIDATSFHGVRRRPLKDLKGNLIFKKVTAPNNVLRHAKGQIGKGYDFTGVLGIPFQRNWHKKKRWFCSELIAWAFEKEGIIFQQKKSYRVTPQDIFESNQVHSIWRK